MICYTSINWVVKVKKKEETNIFFGGLGTVKLVDTQAAPAIFVLGQSECWL